MCVQKTPLTEVFYFLPGNGARKCLDCCLMTSLLGTPRGRCDEYSSKIFPQLETKVYRSGEERQTTEGDACKLRDSFEQLIYGASSKLCFASSNVEPAHNTTKYFVSNLQ
jgi:hypothetical protein